jgi:hypothetical protein
MQRENNNLQRKKEPDNSSSAGSTLLGVLFGAAVLGLTAFLGYQVFE